MTIEQKIADYFHEASKKYEMKVASQEDIVRDLLNKMANIESKLKDLEKKEKSILRSLELALEGLNAILEYGDSQGIAGKTLDQINNIKKNITGRSSSTYIF